MRLITALVWSSVDVGHVRRTFDVSQAHERFEMWIICPAYKLSTFSLNLIKCISVINGYELLASNRRMLTIRAFHRRSPRLPDVFIWYLALCVFVSWDGRIISTPLKQFDVSFDFSSPLTQCTKCAWERCATALKQTSQKCAFMGLLHNRPNRVYTALSSP